MSFKKKEYVLNGHLDKQREREIQEKQTDVQISKDKINQQIDYNETEKQMWPPRVSPKEKFMSPKIRRAKTK